jgi:transcriptional regulator with XRE-family HTH domain
MKPLLLIPHTELHAARARAGITQQELAERVRAAGQPLKQATISAWEQGVQAPRPSNPSYRLMLGILGLEGGILPNSRNRPLIWSEVEPAIFERELRLRLGNKSETGTEARVKDIWVTCPNRLAVAGSKKLQEGWAERLAEGTNYNVIWFADADGDVDESYTELFADIAGTARSIRGAMSESNTSGSESGMINHLAVNWIDEPNGKLLRWFDDVCLNNPNFFVEKPNLGSGGVRNTTNVVLPRLSFMTPEIRLLSGQRGKALEFTCDVHSVGRYLQLNNIDVSHAGVLQNWVNARWRWLSIAPYARATASQVAEPLAGGRMTIKSFIEVASSVGEDDERYFSPLNSKTDVEAAAAGIRYLSYVYNDIERILSEQGKP